jgi:gamma-glutamylcyclotransferase (GGCT)/AIG2-like uncharacterized protein YtfP
MTRRNVTARAKMHHDRTCENRRPGATWAFVVGSGGRQRMSELLFSYGTLRQREVQLATFGRPLVGELDAIVGYDLDYVTITDPHVIATSGSDRHPILRPSDRPDAHVDGMVFAISAAELAAADRYEVDDYRRISASLQSGGHAWVYVFAG